MNNRILKALSVVLPILFVLAVIFMRISLFTDEQGNLGNLVTAIVVVLGATFFSIFIFNIIESRELEIQQRSLQLEALHEAALALTHELDLQVVLQKVVDLSRELLGAKYGALAVQGDEEGHIEQFFTSGISEGDRQRIAHPPQGQGILNLSGPSREPIIVDDIKTDPRSSGFPFAHPDMKSLVGVPIESKGELFGNLYLANKLPNSQNADDRVDVFLESDRQLLEKFATQGAIAIENAQLYRKTQELAVLQERERFSMDLHDGIMQSVYGTGLSLQEVKIQMGSGQPEVTTRVEGAIGDLSQVLRDIRNYIMGLRPGRFQEQNIVTGINEIALELRANTLLNVQVESLPAEEFEPWDGEDTAELLFITQEALTNIRKHSHARNVAIQLTRDQQQLVIKIKDDGIGFDPDVMEKSQGQGLHNMRERARNVGATIEILPSRGEGTLIKLLLPVPDAVDE